MTNDNAALANDTPRPVADWENRHVKGEALVCKKLHDKHVAEVAELRKRQEAYLASLPKEPVEALMKVNNIIKDTHEIDSTHYAPRAALAIIQQLSINEGLDNSTEMNHAVYWLTCQGLDGMTLIEGASQEAMKIAQQFHPMGGDYRA